MLDGLVATNYCHIKLTGDQPLFSWRLVSLDGKSVTAFNGLRIDVDCSLEELEKSADPNTMVWVIPAVYSILSNIEKTRRTLQHLQPFTHALRQFHDQGGVVASTCNGSFMLAAAGLLDQHSALMHWKSEQNFKQLFPHISIDTRSNLADYGRVICTIGGRSSDAQLVLHFAQRYCGRELALSTAKLLMVDINVTPQTAFRELEPDGDHHDGLVRRAQLIMLESLHQSIRLDDIAADLNISGRQFKRRFVSAVGITPIKYLQQQRMRRACQLLETTERPSAQIGEAVGYRDEASFRRLFKRTIGVSASEYRRQFKHAS